MHALLEARGVGAEVLARRAAMRMQRRSNRSRDMVVYCGKKTEALCSRRQYIYSSLNINMRHESDTKMTKRSAVPESPFLGQDCSASCHDLVDVLEELFDIRIEKHRDDSSLERQGDYPE